MKGLRSSRKVEHLMGKVGLTAITIREKAVERAIQARRDGFGPDRILFMVSTSESHHRVNSGLSLEEYWKMCGVHSKGSRCRNEGMRNREHDMGVPDRRSDRNGESSEFAKRWLDIGADDIEHADHDGSAPPDRVYQYYSMILDAIPDTTRHIAHFHVTRGWGLANILAALQAGITHFESTLGGIGGQPANFVDGVR